MGFMRWLAVIPAAIVTVVLFVLMMSLISEEFKPQDKLDLASFEINPKVEEVKLLERETKITEIKQIETPPPPPQIERQKADRPAEPIADLRGAVPEFEAPEIDRSQFQITVSDRDAQPLVRIPPIMPPRAEKSGHCKVRFNVSPEGQPFDVVATYCTQSLFERPTIRSVQKWKYNPKIQDGLPVGRTGVESKITFRLADERGNIIPE
ncbi:MAG: energy transducer TonB [Pseudomonadota bacterium]